ncbi:YbaK/EbsC family protein [Algirhabdus cladophorae]|uniref:YbaK/EbsC family protein n=1 Tax=Algirhabdus cladophorae TaxID=3377108 RepID=UPI003B84AD91
MSKSLKRVQRVLDDAGLKIEVLELGPETRTAQQAADAAGCGVDQIAKSIIFQGTQSGAIYLFVTAGGNQVDVAKAKQIAGEDLGKADAATIRAKTGFAIGGVAPIGHLTPSRGFLDPKLLEFAQVYAAAGTPRHIFAITPRELQEISTCQPVDFTS